MDIKQRFDYHKLKVLKTIGKGTYGNVYLCKMNNNELSIIKDIEFISKHQDNMQDILNEVKILSSLSHPNIVKFYDCLHYGDTMMISMEYATEGNLAEYMYQKYPKQLNQQEILMYFAQILLGVKFIHDKDIIHRDLKAENILLSGKHGVLIKIGDFGISKMLASAKNTSTIIGTPYYLAPELCDGLPYDTKSDVWALGCLLYEMCSHKRAFESESLVGLVKKITSGSVVPIDLTVYERGVQDLIDCMLSILPEKRPTVQQLLAKPILESFAYTVFLDAGNDELLYKTLVKLKDL